MKYSFPSLKMVEEFKGDGSFYAPKIPWLTLLCCVMITVGQTLKS
jgi:hypothetical protein